MTTANEYLKNVLAAQTFAEDSEQLKDLEQRRKDVEKVLRDKSGSSPTIRYGGSKAKGTMILESYDLDIVCYFAHDDTSGGETLEDIYNNVRKTLEAEYVVEQKGSALRLRDRSGQTSGIYIHVDVVPGRFTDESKGDVFLYRSTGEKKRLKTNLDVHINHVRDSGVRDEIRLMKLWNVRNVVSIRTFVLELLVIKTLDGNASDALATRLEDVFTEFRDNSEKLSVEDPANPEGNDLSELLNDSVRSELASVAGRTLTLIGQSGWEPVFGQVEDKKANKQDAVRRAATAVTAPTKPWSREA